MKKLLTIGLAVALIAAYVFAAPQVLVNNLNSVSGSATNTLTFTARGQNLKVYTSAGDVALITPNYTNSSVYTTYPKFVGTTEKTFDNIFKINSVVSLKMTSAATNAIYFLIYND